MENRLNIYRQYILQLQGLKLDTNEDLKLCWKIYSQKNAINCNSKIKLSGTEVYEDHFIGKF